MKILIITRNAWDDSNAIGNTVSNFFSGIKDIEFANIYFRSALPKNELCSHYYQTSEVDVIKNWCFPQKIGKQFFLEQNQEKILAKSKEKNERFLIRIIQKKGIRLAYKASDYIWYSKRWINNNLKDFVESFCPDMIFAFVKSAPQYYLTIRFLRENYNIPLLSWIADDEYTELLQKKSKREIQNLKYILDESVMVKGCSQEICDYYNSIFQCNAEPLYKSCDLSVPIKTQVNNPMMIVYAGNLLYGRLTIVRQIADLIEKFSSEGLNIVFEVYSNTALLASEVQEYFGKMISTRYMGKRDYRFIKERLSKADIVLHVESFNQDQIIKTRYSFSTKIIDYLQSGSVLLAIGPQEIASMKYIKRVPGAYVVNDLANLDQELRRVLEDSSSFVSRAKESREFAKQHHDSVVISKELEETMKKIVQGGK